jgi:hypothetical protein
MSAIAVASIAGSLIASEASKSSANKAADAQRQAGQAGIDESRRQFDAIRALLEPYVSAGNKSITSQGDLIGLNGPEAQQNAINGLMTGPQMSALVKSGEESILQNASATGGLRGGNVQAALAQFRPQMLSQLIQQQYQNLGGLTSIGQNAAAGVGNAGMATSSQISDLLQQMGAASAGQYMAQGKSNAQMWNAVGKGIGTYLGSQSNTGSNTQETPAW